MTNEMTAKEAVKQIKGNCYFASISEKTKQALDMAIKALETTCIEDYPTCTECEVQKDIGIACIHYEEAYDIEPQERSDKE